jgi:hypothetical protein
MIIKAYKFSARLGDNRELLHPGYNPLTTPTTTAIATDVSNNFGLKSGSNKPRIAGVNSKIFNPNAPRPTPVTPPRNPSNADSHNTM